MPIPGGFLSGTLLPWVLTGPLLPLCILLIRRTVYNSTSISLILLCVVSLLTGFFNLALPEQETATQTFEHISFLLEFLFSILVLKTCIRHAKHSYIIVASGLIYCGIFLTLLSMRASPDYPAEFENIGYALLFMLSLSVIIRLFNDISRALTDLPVFWIVAGIFFQSGLLSLLLFLNNDVKLNNLPEDGEFGVMYTIISTIKFIFFSIGLLLFKKAEPDH